MYNPDLEDIAWARNIINIIAEGGTLVFPSVLLIYEVSHEKRTLVLQNTERLKESKIAWATHFAAISTFALHGYTVMPDEASSKGYVIFTQ